MRRRYIPGVLFFLLVLAGCGASTDVQQPAAADSAGCDAKYVLTAEAGNHIGQEVTVCGEVRDYYYSQSGADKPTLLLFDAGVGRRQSGMEKLPDVFSVVIFRSAGKSFPPHFGNVYSGEMLCTTGIVELYDEKPAANGPASANRRSHFPAALEST